MSRFLAAASRPFVSFALVLAPLLVLLGILAWSFSRAGVEDGVADSSYATIAEVQSIATSLASSDANATGYMLTGQSTFLAMQAQEERTVESHLPRLAHLLVDHEEESRLLKAFHVVFQKWQREFPRPMLAREPGLSMPVEAGRSSFREMKTLLEGVQVLQQARISEAEQRQEAYKHCFRAVLVAGSVFSILSCAALAIWINKNGKWLASANIDLRQEMEQRNRVEGELRQSRERYRSLVANLPDVVWTASADGALTFVGENVIAGMGYTIEEFLAEGGRFWLSRIHPDEIEWIHRAFLLLFSDGRLFDECYRLQRKDGTWIWVHSRAVGTYEKDGVRYADGIAADVTDRKTAEEALRRSEERYRRILDTANEGVWMVNAQADTLYVNHQMAGMLGYSRAEMVGRTPYHFVSKAHRRAAAERLRQVTDGIRSQFDFPLRHRDGSEVWVLVCLTPTYDEHGDLDGGLAMLTNVTERRQADAALQQSEERFRHLVEQAADAFFVLNDQGAIVDVNQRACDSLGYSHEELLARTIGDLELEAEGLPTLRALRNIAPGTDVTVQAAYRRKDGSMVPVEVRLGSFASGQQRLVLALARDITERNRAELELERINKQLIEVSRQAGMAEVATSVLHNVGNVLNSVNVSCAVITDKVRKSRVSSVAKTAHLLRQHTADLPGFFEREPAAKQLPDFLQKLAERLAGEQRQIQEELALLSKNVEHIKEIVAMQQSYAHIHGVREIVPVVSLVEDALRMNTAALQRNGVRIIREYADVPPVSVDRHKVLQILVNLIRNAKHALAEQEGSEKEIRIRIGLDGNRRVAVSVRDTGIGIAEENITRIFAHGFTTKKNGHGFGLHSGVLAAQEMGGNLTVDSEGLGRGATFTLEIPLDASELS